MTRNSRTLLFSACAVCALTAVPGGAQTVAPSLIVYDAHVLTVDKNFSTATAFAVMPNGRFGLVGSDQNVLASAGTNTEKIDLHGKTVAPGFIDTHVHITEARGITTKTEVDLTQVTSIKEMQKAISDRAKEMKPGEIIVGSRGWWNYKLAEKRNPTKAELDKAAPNNPVILQVTHYSIVNSAALKAAGITKDSPNPRGGIIEKGKDGEPDGILFDRAGRPVSELIPRPTPEDAYQGVRTEIGRMNAKGLTSAQEPGGSEIDAQMYRKMLDSGELHIRLDMCRNVDPLLPQPQLEKALDDLGPPGQAIDGMFRSDCIAEAGLDGASGLTEFTRADYPGKPGYRGLQIVPQDRYNAFAISVARRNWRVAVHAGGDAAIDEALTAFRLANVQGHRWSLDHAILMKPDQYDKIKQLGLVVNSQYAHDGEGGLKTLEGWNREWADQTEHYKDWLAHGIEFAAGSDGPISYMADPMFEMWGMVTRKTAWGGSLAPDQGITREQALRTLTYWGAYTTFEENVKGTIEPEKYADFVVLGADIMTEPADEIRTTKVLTTYLGGKPVYGELHTAAQ